MRIIGASPDEARGVLDAIEDAIRGGRPAALLFDGDDLSAVLADQPEDTWGQVQRYALALADAATASVAGGG